jgi:hypothetical protein
MELAPVLLSVYSRLDHIKNTVNALQKNVLAGKSNLYIVSDGPKKGDENLVAAVREYIHTIAGFKEITIIERKTNNRVFNNRDGMKRLLNRYGRFIYLEEDIVTAPGFLDFMNSALEEYKTRSDIFAICGYTPPVNIASFYKKDVYVSPRFSAWGFGIWRDRFEKIVMDRTEFKSFLENKNLVKKFSRNGTDMVRLLKREAEGAIDALDVKIFYTQFKYGLFTIAPTVSLTNNTGHDGSGFHCGISNKYDTPIAHVYKKLQLEKNIPLNKKIARRLYFFRSNIPLSYTRRLKKAGIKRVKQFIKTVKRITHHKS